MRQDKLNNQKKGKLMIKQLQIFFIWLGDTRVHYLILKYVYNYIAYHVIGILAVTEFASLR